MVAGDWHPIQVELVNWDFLIMMCCFLFTDSCLVRTVAVDGSELLADIGECLNKDKRAFKNWRNLANGLKIPHEVYDAFDTSKEAEKSPTKMLFEWLATCKPHLSVGDLLTGLEQIDRYDVVELVTKETTVGEFIINQNY